MMGSNFRSTSTTANALWPPNAIALPASRFRVFAFSRYALTRFRAFVYRANSRDGRPVSQRTRVPNASDPEPAEAERPRCARTRNANRTRQRVRFSLAQRAKNV